LKVPYSHAAEANVVGCALARARPSHYDARDCYVPAHARLLEAAKELSDVVPQRCDPSEVDWAALYPFGWPSFERIRAVAAAMLADVEIGDAVSLVERRCEPSVGRDSATVGRLARSRRAMAALAEAYNVLGEGGDVEDVAAMVGRAVA